MPRSIADQTVQELGGPTSVFVRQRNDHVELDRLLRELDGTTGTEQDGVLRRIDRVVFSHAFAEETVLWPVIRRVLPDGDALTLQVEEEHQEVNELTSELERLGHADPRRAALLARLVEVLREDVRDEEDALFPRLQKALDATALRRLGLQWELARRMSPTRPHPPSPAVRPATSYPACRSPCSTASATSWTPRCGTLRSGSHPWVPRSAAGWPSSRAGWSGRRRPGVGTGRRPVADGHAGRPSARPSRPGTRRGWGRDGAWSDRRTTTGTAAGPGGEGAACPARQVRSCSRWRTGSPSSP